MTKIHRKHAMYHPPLVTVDKDELLHANL